MNSPPPTQITAAPTWIILNTKYQVVCAAKMIETATTAAPMIVVATTDVRRRLSTDGAATASDTDPSPCD
jgi:hypothetical protein